MLKPACDQCHRSDMVKRKGWYKNKSTGEGYRIWYCNRCGHKFVRKSITKGKRHKRKVVVEAGNLRRDGFSLRKIATHLNSEYGTKISPSTVLRWTREQRKLLSKFEKKQKSKTKIKGRVHIDEAVVKIKGVSHYYVQARDSKTKYNLIGILMRHRYLENVKKLFKRLKYDFANRPKHVVADGFENYETAFNKYFRRIAEITPGVPIACKKYGLEHNNNCIERRNGYVKELGKLTRGYKNFYSTFDYLELQRICLNFIHPLESLGTKRKRARTPAEVAAKLKFETYVQLIRAAEREIYY